MKGKQCENSLFEEEKEAEEVSGNRFVLHKCMIDYSRGVQTKQSI